MKVIRTPRSVDLHITGKCNLRCKYCSHFESGGDVGEDLSTEEWVRFIHELGECAVMDVCLQGGEPFMRQDLKELINAIVLNRMRFSILSNGTLITEDMAAFLASTRRCNSVQVSIDGSTPFTHDACRGEGNFVRAVKGLKILQQRGIPATVRVTIHRQNVHDLEAVVRMLLEDMELPSISTNSAAHFGLCRKNAEQVELTAQERSVAMASLLELTDRYGARISATAGPLAEAQDWVSIEKLRSAGVTSLPGRGVLAACNGPASKIAVRRDGVIVPCSQIPDMELGRINKDSLRKVWTDHPVLRRFRTRSEIPLSDFSFCSDCSYIPFCKGGCPATAWTELQDAWHPSPEGCYRRFLEAGGQVPDL